MKAAVFYQPHISVSIEELELELLRDGEVLLDIVAAGVCHSDYHLIDGHRTPRAIPWVMGNEGAGVFLITNEANHPDRNLFVGNLIALRYWPNHWRH
jgi:Zn-dependent alcohol dehydrogenase